MLIIDILWTLAGKEKIPPDGEKASQGNDAIMTAETTNHVNELSKQVTVGDLVNESDKVPPSEEDTAQMYTKDVNDAHQKESRCTCVLVLEIV